MPDWFVRNVADAKALTHPRRGAFVRFEERYNEWPELGFNVTVLEPGKPNCKYHSESVQEAFLVLSGECILIVNGEERQLGSGDFFHCPPGTEHVFVGAGDGPCTIVMVGARRDDEKVHYPVNEVAARYGASVETATDDAGEAYADWGRDFSETRIPWPPP